MSLKERDPVSGYTTTGHDWNGIKELNTPVPRTVWFFLVATFLYSLVSWVLLPAWPFVSGYTKGLLGIDQRVEVAAKLADAREAGQAREALLAGGDFNALAEDPEMMAYVLASGAPLFGDNCQVCHGPGGTGGPGFPPLDGGFWLWGGSPAEIAQTIRAGINSGHAEAHMAQMPAFGQGGMLTRQEIGDVTAFLIAGSGGSDPRATPGRAVEGKAIYGAQCAACHGADGSGMAGSGIPSLMDGAWIYGGDWDAIHRSIDAGRQGQMPAWDARLTDAQINTLALYVATLRGGK